MPQDMRGLTQYIADLRACKVRELEEKRVNKEMAHIRQKFKEGNLDGYQRKKYLSKIVFTYILGYEVDVGHMESVNLISSSKYSEKQIGYLALTLLMHENSDIVRLVVNSIRKDLDSMDEATNCLALHAIANIGGKEMADSLAVDVHRLLISPTSKSFVKKKAALTLLRLYRKSPECVDAKEWGLRIVSIMDDRNLGVALSVASLVSALAVDNLEDLAVSYQKAVDRLNKIVVEQQYSSDYVYYRVPIPWLQVKLLRLLQLYPPHDDPNIRNLLHNVLRVILENAKETPKNVQHNNAQNAVLFEAISLAIHLDTESSLVHSAAALLGRFVLSKETNVRYLGMDTMAQLASRSESLEVVKRHQDTVIFSLKDRDVSVRRRALDLLYSMCDGSNAKTIVGELLKYLNVADYSLREEMVLKIAIMTEKFATEYEWYVDTILRLMSQAGDYVGEEVWHRIVQIVTNTEELQEYAARKVYDHLRAPTCHENVIKVAAYLLGEFGHLIANEDDPSAITPIEQFTLINNRIATSSPSTKALILTTYVKWLNLFPEIRDHIIAVLRKFTHTLDAELQQRACEYLAIAGEEDVLQVVLDEMPPYPEQRESALVGRLIRKHGGKQQVKDTSRRKTTTAKVEETPEHAAEVATQDDLLSGLEGLVLTPAPVATTPGVTAPLPSTTALGSSTSAPTPPLPATSTDTPSEAAPLIAQAIHFTHGADKALQRLAYSSEGILWEDAQLQIGLKSEYHGHLGRLALYFGNKISAAFDSFTVTVESQEPAALGVTLPKILPSTLAGTTQMQQVVQLECKALFDIEKQPILRVSYLAGSLNTLTLKLPVFLNKFIEGVDLGAADFFERWKRVAAGEAQSIYQLKKGDTKRRVKGLGLRILEGIDPNPGNAVGAGVFHTASGKVGCLLRLEPNGEMARLTIRSTDGNVSARLLSITELCTKA